MKKEIVLAIALAMGSTFALAGDKDKAGAAAEGSSATGAATQQPAARASDGTKDQGASDRAGAAGPAGSAEPSASGSSDKPMDPAATPKDEEGMKKKAQ